MAKIKITTSTADIRKKLKTAIGEKLQQSSAERFLDLQDKIVDFFVGKFKQTDTYYSLVSPSGILRGEFGITNSIAVRMDNIITRLLRVYIEQEDNPSLANKKITKITIGVSRKDYTDVNIADLGTIISENGFLVPWLEWLLFAGTEPVVANHYVFFKQDAGRSRIAIMLEDDNESYSVAPEHAGTIGSNWITRTLNQHSQEFLDIIRNYQWR